MLTNPQGAMIREGMRGEDHQQNHVFSYLSPEMRVRPDHPLRTIRAMVAEVLSRLSRRFDSMYAKVCRPSIAPEKLLLAQVVAQASGQGLTSDEHVTVDGTLLEAWAGAKSFQAKEGKAGPPPDDPGNPTVDFHGEQRTNDTHESKTDPEAQMARKGPGKESKLSYSGNLLVENRNG